MSGSVAVVDFNANELGRIGVLGIECPASLVKNYVVCFLHNQRQWSASTKTRSEVAHSTQKARKQKGSGRARLGSLAAPQCVGGGRVGAPRPKFNVGKHLNRKEIQRVFSAVFSDRANRGKIFVLRGDFSSMDKAANMMSLVNALRVLGGKKIGFVMDCHQEIQNAAAVRRGVGNLRNVSLFDVNCINGYDILSSSVLFISEIAWASLAKSRLQGIMVEENTEGESKE